MGHGNMEFRGRQSARQGRVRVAKDQDPVGFFGQEHFLNSLEHGAGLGAVLA